MLPPPPPPPPRTIFHQHHHALKFPKLTLLLLFLVTRLTYLTIALLTPSPAYDSSTNLILPPQDASGIICRGSLKLAERLTRWDAIYFVKISERGYLREQEWAFGWGWTKVMGLVGRAILYLSPTTSPYPYIFAGVLVSNLSHLLSVFVLYNLTKLVYPKEGDKVAFVASVIHVLTPAGIFLVAPYSEGLFALLSFMGYYLYVRSTHVYYRGGGGWRQMGWVVAAGVVWMLAGMVRSNGVLNGVVVAVEFVREGWILLRGRGERGVGRRLLRIAGLGIAGVLVGLGLVVPQGIAWMQFCAAAAGGGGGGGRGREWCSRTLPSIYSYVQDKYWNVGFLRYWTAGNIPLFLLAAPVLYILTRSSVWAMMLNDNDNDNDSDTPSSSPSQPTPLSKPPSTAPTSTTNNNSSNHNKHNNITANTPLIQALALPQLILALLAFTSYHVQIINRLSSGYVVWYWWLAQTILYAEGASQGRMLARWAVRWCVGYALVQAVLFAGFLPPA